MWECDFLTMSEMVIKTKVVAVELDVKTHEKLEKLIAEGRRKGLLMSKKKLCKLIITENIKGVGFT